MTAKKSKSGRLTTTLDLSTCEKLDHLQAVPKARSASITSIESPDGLMQAMLKPAPRRDFDDLMAFESFIRDETWDNDFDYCHAHLTYYPPFILKEVHNNLDKIKPTMNKNSRKFKRNLQHHIKKHLMQDMQTCSGFQMDFNKVGMEETPTKVKWRFEDIGDHGFSKEEEEMFDRHWKLELEVTCNNENPLVEVDYKATPIM